MEIRSKYFKFTTDKDLFAYFRTYYAHYFSPLTDLKQLIRQAANLNWQVKALVPGSYARWSKTVGGTHMTKHFAVTRIRVHDLWYFQRRLIRKILAHTLCGLLNRLLGKKDLQFDQLVQA